MLSACCFPSPVAQIFSNTIFSLAPLVIGKDNDDDDDTDDDVEKEEADQCDGMEGRLRVEGSAKCVTNVIELAGPRFLAALPALHLPFVSDCHFRILNERVTCET